MSITRENPLDFPIPPTGGRLPKLTPILIGVFRSLAASTIVLTLSGSRMFPGFSLKPSTPPAIASNANAKIALEDIINIMRTPPTWAPSLPLDAEGAYGDHYVK